MKIFVDSEFKCHLSGDSAAAVVETDYFDDKCDAYIEGFRFVPEGESWTRSDGEVFHGEMITPWKDFNELDAAQREYALQKLAEYEALINELYAEVAAE